MKSLQLCHKCNYMVVDNDRDFEDGIILKCRTIRISKKINIICPKCKTMVELSDSITDKIIDLLKSNILRTKKGIDKVDHIC